MEKGWQRIKCGADEHVEHKERNKERNKNLCRSSRCSYCLATLRQHPSGCFCCACSWRSFPHSWSPAPAGRHTNREVEAKPVRDHHQEFKADIFQTNWNSPMDTDLTDQGSRSGLPDPRGSREQSSLVSRSIILTSKFTEPCSCTAGNDIIISLNSPLGASTYTQS